MTSRAKYYDDERTRRYDEPKGYSQYTPDAFASAKTIYLYQIVQDVVIGTGHDENGELYTMQIPIGLDMYYSQEFGGPQSTFPMSDWRSTNKQVMLKGYLYNGRTYNRAVKEGRELGDYMSNCMKQVEDSVNFYFSPHSPEVIKVTPTWAWFSLLLAVSALTLLALTITHI